MSDKTQTTKRGRRTEPKSESKGPIQAVTPEEALEKRARERAFFEAREARRASLRFWSKTACGGVAVALLAFGTGRALEVVKALPYFNFSTLEVSGDVARVPAERVKEALEPVLQGNYFSEDLEAVRRAVETVPWVRKAAVRRVWPNVLQVNVEAYKVLALYEDGRLVDSEGVLFTANPDERDDPSLPLPNFYGPTVQTTQLSRYYREFSRALEPIGVVVTDVSCSDRGAWSLVMSSADVPPTRIEIGQDNPVGSVVTKLADMAASYPRVVELMDGPPASIDLRYNRAFAATLPDREALLKHREGLDNTETADEESEIQVHNEQPE